MNYLRPPLCFEKDPGQAGERVQFFARGPGYSLFLTASSDPLSTTLITPVVLKGGIPANVEFSGWVPGFVGFYRIDAQVPRSSPTGEELPGIVRVGGMPSNTVRMAIQ